MRLKLSLSGAVSPPVTLPDTCTLSDVAAAARTVFGASLPAGPLSLHTGFPPSLVWSGAADEGLLSAATAGIRSGSVIDVRLLEPPPSRRASDAAALPPLRLPPGSGGAGTTTAPATPGPSALGATAPVPPADAATWACGACTLLNSRSAAVCGVCGGPRPPAGMVRHVVPSDNHCLFTALGFLHSGGRSMGRAGELRVSLSAHMLAHPEAFSEAVLGEPPAAYARRIATSLAWGGGLEMAAASDVWGLQVAAVCIKTGRISLFGEDQPARRRRLYVLYDGVHFDALVRESSPLTTIFDAGDAEAEAGALQVAEAARRARQYVDLAGFALMCSACGAGLTGQEEAVAHAGATGHTSFQEYADPAAKSPRK